MRKDLILHLLGGIGNYLLSETPKRMIIAIHPDPDGLHICVQDDNTRTEEEVNRMREALNSEKRPELAAYYGAMTGHDLLGTTRLNLLGWQVKHADVRRTKRGVRIDIWVGGEAFEGHIPFVESDCLPDPLTGDPTP